MHYPQTERVMLATSMELSSINYHQYTETSLPVLKVGGNEYDYHKMMDIDHPDYDSEDPYPNLIGSDADWTVWEHGRKKGKRNKLSDGSNSETYKYYIPYSGGYGCGNATLITELPEHFCSRLKVSIPSSL